MKIKDICIFTILLSSFLVQLSCSKNVCGCVTPPPQYRFTLVDKNDKTWITKANADSLQIIYKEGSETKKIANLSVAILDSTGTKQFNHVVTTGEIISISNRLNDPFFDVVLQGKLLGKIQLKTITSSPDYSGWATISEVLFNGKKPTTSASDYLDIFKTEL